VKIEIDFYFFLTCSVKFNCKFARVFSSPIRNTKPFHTNSMEESSCDRHCTSEHISVTSLLRLPTVVNFTLLCLCTCYELNFSGVGKVIVPLFLPSGSSRRLRGSAASLLRAVYLGSALTSRN
jgi:hypothetical protein